MNSHVPTNQLQQLSTHSNLVSSIPPNSLPTFPPHMYTGLFISYDFFYKDISSVSKIIGLFLK